jgi:hypothetical protein
MTAQESFKRRVRARMAKTGERYAAARRALIDQADARTGGSRVWRSQPETGDRAVVDATGRSWDDWVDLIEADGPIGQPPSMDDHPAIAAWLTDRHGLDGWWAQTVTGGYERITGVRLPYQRPDGTFTAGKSATVSGDAEELRALLLDEAGRVALFPGHNIELLSRPSAKAIRLAVGNGVAQLSLTDTGDGRVKVSVAHERLPDLEEVERWKFWWEEWLVAIDADEP